MTFVARIHRLLRADVNACLERLEDPEQVLRLAVADMEDEIARLEGQQSERNAKREYLQRDLSRRRTLLQSLAEELDAALQAERDDLARAVIARRLGLAREIREMSIVSDELAQALDDEAARLGEYHENLAEVRAQMARCAVAGSSEGSAEERRYGTLSTADVELELLREKQRRGLA